MPRDEQFEPGDGDRLGQAIRSTARRRQRESTICPIRFIASRPGYVVHDASSEASNRLIAPPALRRNEPVSPRGAAAGIANSSVSSSHKP